MLRPLFCVSAVDLGVATALLLMFGRLLRWPTSPARFGPALLSLAGCASVAAISGSVAYHLWRVPLRSVVVAAVILAVAAIPVVLARHAWNFVGQLFLSAYVAGALCYIVYGLSLTVGARLTPVLRGASALLLAIEVAALTLSTSFAFETCDVLCRRRTSGPLPTPDRSYCPMVSLHIAAYNEPPGMLIETIKAAEALDYPSFEIVVIDNNTKDPAVYGPVEEYCRERRNVRFVHVDPWPGYKSGALNLALVVHTDPRAEIVGVIDADYLVSPDYLRETVGHFADERLAFVQTPQDYRGAGESSYLTACYDAYRYFFAMAMASRNERDSVIFAGTMGLLRRSALEQIGGWDEWCITEDAEASLRLLRLGWSGLFLPSSYGRGLMPLEFATLKRQRFRWCFGGMQILRRHWRSLVPWRRTPANQLSVAQRIDYLLGGLQWLNDALLLCFSVMILTAGAVVVSGEAFPLRPLLGPMMLLPVALLGSGMLRALWALRQHEPLSYRRSLLALANWLSLSWVVALACGQGLFRKQGVFLRTPKVSGAQRVSSALWAARSESVLAVALFALAGLLARTAHPPWLLFGVVAWQGLVYASSPFMSLLSRRSERGDRGRVRRAVIVATARLAAAIAGGSIYPAAVATPLARPTRWAQGPRTPR